MRSNLNCDRQRAAAAFRMKVTIPFVCRLYRDMRPNSRSHGFVKRHALSLERHVLSEQRLWSAIFELDRQAPDTLDHSINVMAMALAFGYELHLTDHELDELALGALFHDVGKLHIPRHILQKVEALDESEIAYIRLHPMLGYRHMHGLLPLGSETIIRSHHERFDGTGYPQAKQVGTLPVVVQVAALVDTVVAMSEDRPYRTRLSGQQIASYLRQEQGSQFSPILAELYLNHHLLPAEGIDFISADVAGRDQERPAPLLRVQELFPGAAI